MDLTLLSLSIKVFKFKLAQTIAMPNFIPPKSGICRFRHSLDQDSLYSTQTSYLCKFLVVHHGGFQLVEVQLVGLIMLEHVAKPPEMVSVFCTGAKSLSHVKGTV